MMTYQKLLAGGVSGFLSAFVVDLHAWSKQDGAYNWGLAAKRWIAGAFAGIAAAMGVAGVE